MTHKIAKYYHPKYPISIFDTPGIENTNTIIYIKIAINQLDNDIKQNKNNIDQIIYYTKLNQRSFLQLEIEFIKDLLSKDKKIIFVFNDFGASKKNAYKLISYAKDSLNLIMKYIKLRNNQIMEILDNIILLNQKQSIEEDEDEENELIINQCYGMDSLFIKIYQIFLSQKICITELDKSRDIKKMMNFIKSYKLL